MNVRRHAEPTSPLKSFAERFQRRSIFVIFIDLEKAFECARADVIIPALIDLGISGISGFL